MSGTAKTWHCQDWWISRQKVKITEKSATKFVGSEMTPLESFPKIHSNLGGYASLLKLSRDVQLTQTWVGGDASALRLIGDSVVRGLSSSPPAMD